MNRRDFTAWVGIGALATSLPIVLAACDGDSPPAADAPGEDTTATGDTDAAGGEALGTVAELDEAGQLLNEQAIIGPVLLIRDPADDESVIGVNPVCPHSGCNVEWQSDQTLFVCPCHNSQFNADGSLAQGPATQPLNTYEVALEGDQIVAQ
ncbi:MAG: Rieske 2Fe-2S domain-containing protein [Cyanobacteria bacterium P01_A01_bin.123]